MIFTAFTEMLQQVAAHSGKNDKIGVIKRFAMKPYVKLLLHEALSPFTVFYLKKIPEVTAYVTPVEGMEPTAEDVFRLLDSLKTRALTGNRAITAVSSMLSVLDADDRDVLIKVLTKDLKIGSAAGIVNKAIPGWIPEFDVSLAEPYDEDRLELPAIVQPKIDGLRVVAFVRNGYVEYKARSGKPFDTLESLTPSLLSLFADGTVVDGEVTSDSFLESISAVKRKTAKKAGEHNIIFHVFDVMTGEEFHKQITAKTQVQRLTDLDLLFSASKDRGEGITNVRVLPFQYVLDQESLDDYFDQALDAGYEGVIVKRPHARYAFKRSHDWMKIKPSENHDVTITGFIEGKKGGKTEGMLGAITYEVPNQPGVEGKVGTGFSIELRKWIWENRSELLGTVMEISAMKREGKGMVRLQHPRFEQLRSYKGEKF